MATPKWRVSAGKGSTRGPTARVRDGHPPGEEREDWGPPSPLPSAPLRAGPRSHLTRSRPKDRPRSQPRMPSPTRSALETRRSVSSLPQPPPPQRGKDGRDLKYRGARGQSPQITLTRSRDTDLSPLTRYLREIRVRSASPQPIQDPLGAAPTGWTPAPAWRSLASDWLELAVGGTGRSRSDG